jgi:hypothetical protein
VREVIALHSEFELPHLILTFMDGKPSRDSIAAHDGEHGSGGCTAWSCPAGDLW